MNVTRLFVEQGLTEYYAIYSASVADYYGTGIKLKA